MMSGTLHLQPKTMRKVSYFHHTFQISKLNVILKDDTYHVIYNNDLRVYIQSPPWQGEIKIFPNPSISKAKISFTKKQIKYFDSWSCCAQN